MRRHHPPVHTRNRPGFSLLELMVVIVVLAVLAGVLIPAVSSVAHRSQVTKDLTNLRSLQGGHFQFAVDSGGKFADAGFSHGGIANEKIAWLNVFKFLILSERDVSLSVRS